MGVVSVDHVKAACRVRRGQPVVDDDFAEAAVEVEAKYVFPTLGDPEAGRWIYRMGRLQSPVARIDFSRELIYMRE